MSKISLIPYSQPSGPGYTSIPREQEGAMTPPTATILQKNRLPEARKADAPGKMDVHAIVNKAQQQLPPEHGVQLKAGLDAMGKNPGMVIVELVDTRTKQVYFRMPPEQATDFLHGQKDAPGLQPGVLINRRV